MSTKEALKAKVCTKCATTLPIDDFSEDKRSAGGRRSICKRCISAYNAEYRKKNSEKSRARDAAYRAANKEKVRAAKARWVSANQDKVKKYRADWVENNPERDKASKAAWAKANPESGRIKSHKRRAKIRGIGGSLSKGLAAKLLKLQRGLCACCREPLGNDYHMDHIVPVALGGMNVDSNIQLLHGKCNQQKSDAHPVDFMQRKGFLL